MVARETQLASFLIKGAEYGQIFALQLGVGESFFASSGSPYIIVADSGTAGQVTCEVGYAT